MPTTATATHDPVAEARLLLQQALRLLDDHVRVSGADTRRGPLTDLAADLADEATQAPRHLDGDVEGPASDDHSLGWVQ